MSHSGIPGVEQLAHGLNKLTGGLGDALQGKGIQLPQPVPVTVPTPENLQARTQDFATREQDLTRRAAAAGALRSGNEADLLGYASPQAKRVGAARVLLG